MESQEVARVGVYLEFEPVGAEGLACHLCCEDGFLCRAYAGGVGQQLYAVVLRDVREEVVVLVAKLDAFHGHGDHLRAAGLDGFRHEGVVVELACPEEQA